MPRCSIYKSLCAILMCVVCVACANRGVGPQGGPMDSIPPVPLSAIPLNGSVNFTGTDIEVTFDEYIQLDNIAQNLLMSPPQQTPPEVKARGKKLMVHFVDSLRDSTTYTIDFGKAVCDYHEKNPLVGYTFAFSTGPYIDTLMARGRVLYADNLNPAQNIFVGIHSNMHDSAFTALPFDRLARTDSTGAFCIANMHEGQYRLYAVNDVSRDYRLTPGEALAFMDSIISPFVQPHMHTDSLGNDTLVGYDYGPSNIQLWLFEQSQKRLYLQKSTRDKQHLIQLLFSAEPDSMPTLRALKPSEVDTAALPNADSAWIDPMPYIHASYSKHMDTISLWLTDSIAIAQDTILLEATYRRTDSLYQLEWATDTLRAIWRAPRLTEKAKQALDLKNRNRKLELKSNARKGFDTYDTLRIQSSTPIASIEVDSIHLYERIDSVLRPVPFSLEPHDSLPMYIRLLAKINEGKQYEIHLDSAAIRDIYGVTHNALKYTATVKTKEDYSTLRVILQPFVPNARIQLLNNRDEVLREQAADSTGVFFSYLKPDTYYIRMYIDADNNGQWTTGDWATKRQPESVYYYTSSIQTKSNWDFEEIWDYTAVPQVEAKPAELVKMSASKKR